MENTREKIADIVVSFRWSHGNSKNDGLELADEIIRQLSVEGYKSLEEIQTIVQESYDKGYKDCHNYIG